MRTKEKIEELLYHNAEDFKIAKILKEETGTYFGTLEETFATSGGKDFLVKHTKKIDEVLELIYEVAIRRMFNGYQPLKNSLPITLCALGSYGREQLCVYSDIDLLILYKDIPGYNTQEAIEKILYLIWDCGLKLGHRVHSVDELLAVSRTDNTIKTALLESRFIEGSKFLWTEAQNKFKAIRYDEPKPYIANKLEEKDLLHDKYPLNMEPNLKEGVGGFRDANLVYWIGKLKYNIDHIRDLPEHIVKDKEYREFRIALEFLFRVRSALHLAAKKKEDRLRLELLPTVARYLGYDPDKNVQVKFAKKVLGSMRTIELYTTIWTDLLCKEFEVENHQLLQPPERTQTPSLLTVLKHLISSSDNEFTISPAYLQEIIHASRPQRIDKSYFPVIRMIFQQKHACDILYAFYRAQLLGFVIPSTNKVIDLPQFDGYHQYPVDRHLLQSLYHLEHIDHEPIRKLYEALSREDQELLKLVTFMHDAGKGRKKDHSYVGASLFKALAAKLGYSEEMIHDGILLIHFHTLMSSTAQREDLYSEKTILKFAAIFKNKRMLDLIHILTYADMSGVGKDVYNTFTSRLIQTLYDQSLESLEHQEILSETSKRVKKEQHLKRLPHFTSLPKSTQKKILSIPSNLMFLRYHPDDIIRISTEAIEMKQYHYNISNDHFLTIEIIRKEDYNIGYLLAKLSRLDLVNMDICKLFDDLKYFKIDFRESVDDDEIELIKSFVETSFDGTKKAQTVAPHLQHNEIEIDCNHSRSYAMMSLKTKNQKGMMAYLITLFDELGIDVATAKIHTQKNRVQDLFLIEKNGNFCHNTDTIIKKMGVGS